MPIEYGSEAPDFTLTNTEGKEVTLSKEWGSHGIVLLFFPLAFSRVCTDEFCMIRDNMKLYEALETKIFAVSVDSFFTLRAFQVSHNLNFDLLSDFNREVSKKYSVLYKDYFGMKGVSKRAVFLLDRKGTIRYSEVLDDSDHLPDFSRLRIAIENLN